MDGILQRARIGGRADHETTWEYDKHGNKILPRNCAREARAQSSASRRQREDEVKVLVIINAPKRFVGRQHKKQQIEPIVSAIKEVVKDIEGIQFGISQGLTVELRKPRNSLNLLMNPATDREDPVRHDAGGSPQVEAVPPHPGDDLPR